MSKFISVREAADFYGVTLDTIYKAVSKFDIKTKIKAADSDTKGPRSITYVDTKGLNMHLTNARLHGRIYK